MYEFLIQEHRVILKRYFN